MMILGVGLNIATKNKCEFDMQHTVLLTSAQLLNTGRPHDVWPDFPGVTPPTILVPYSIACVVWNAPYSVEIRNLSWREKEMNYWNWKF